MATGADAVHIFLRVAPAKGDSRIRLTLLLDGASSKTESSLLPCLPPSPPPSPFSSICSEQIEREALSLFLLAGRRRSQMRSLAPRSFLPSPMNGSCREWRTSAKKRKRSLARAVELTFPGAFTTWPFALKFPRRRRNAQARCKAGPTIDLPPFVRRLTSNVVVVVERVADDGNGAPGRDFPLSSPLLVLRTRRLACRSRAAAKRRRAASVPSVPSVPSAYRPPKGEREREGRGDFLPLPSFRPVIHVGRISVPSGARCVGQSSASHFRKRKNFIVCRRISGLHRSSSSSGERTRFPLSLSAPPRRRRAVAERARRVR